MGKGTVIFVIILLLIGLYMASQKGWIDLSKDSSNQTDNSSEVTNPSVETIKIANWNLQIFGKAKASDGSLMNTYASIIDDYDIIFIQEIRDADNIAFPKLCALLSDYECQNSSRAGRSTSKEQYGIIYKKGILITDFHDFNPDEQDRWERPPIEVIFDIKGYNLIVYNIHTKPDDVANEMKNLEDVVKVDGNILIIGDLNACDNYYNNDIRYEFDYWNWIIGDDEDTTVSETNCALDRIILSDDAYNEYINYGIYKNITEEMSDHYLVWTELKINNN